MDDFPPLPALGQRIMICGPSNVGKSTLAQAISRAAGLPAVHLDQLRHLPNTDWRQRPDSEFEALHDAAIVEDHWVMEGNYSKLFPQRLRRATGIILIGGNRWVNLARYFRRTLFERARPGHLEGAKDSIKWAMIHWILVRAPENMTRYREILSGTGLPLVQVGSMRELNRLYRVWGLQR